MDLTLVFHQENITDYRKLLLNNLLQDLHLTQNVFMQEIQ